MKKSLSIIYIFLISVTLFCFQQITYGAVSASINNSANNSGEPYTFTTDDIIQLEIDTDHSLNNNIDLSVLNKDFAIVSKGKQISHSIINGNSSTNIQLILGLKPNKSGKLIIPTITIGNEATRPINIKVIDAATDPNLTQEIFMNIEADNQTVYLQSPIQITVNIYVAADITARDLELNNPESNDYTMFKLNENNKQVVYKNKKYNLFQVNYLLFYNSSGTTALPKFKLSGFRLKGNSRSSDIFSLYQQQWLPFTRTNPELKINILPKPSDFNNANWLSAEDLQVEQSWAKNSTTSITDKIKEGEAIQRTITIKGKNVPAEYLPTLYDPKTTTKSNSENYKIYVDKPELSNKIIDNKLHSQLTQKITYITTKPGNIDLPGHKIIWWHTKTKKTKTASLENKSFKITPDPSKSNQNQTALSVDDQNKQQNFNMANSEITTDKSTINNQYSQLKNSEKLFYIIYLLSALILILIFIILYLLIYLKKQSNNKNNVANTGGNNNYNTQNSTQNNTQDYNQKIKLVNKNLKIIKSSAKNGELDKTYKLICAVADDLFYSSNNNTTLNNNFNKLKTLLPLNCQQNINNLTASLYSSNNINWDCQFFINTVIPEIEKLLVNLNNKKEHNKNNFKLPELYPD